ncbi:MAG: hypothetical protein JWQ72_380 [Polaromonas sp.]|nr:hypothetical protein [Polaromonas sp.]
MLTASAISDQCNYLAPTLPSDCEPKSSIRCFLMPLPNSAADRVPDEQKFSARNREALFNCEANHALSNMNHSFCPMILTTARALSSICRTSGGKLVAVRRAL